MKEFSNSMDLKYLDTLAKMSEIQRLNLGEYVASCVTNDERAIEIKPHGISLIFKKDTEDGMNFYEDVMQIVSLIEILKKNDLVFIHENPKIN